MAERFNVGDRVWVVTSGTTQSWVTCPDCFGQCALTVILGDGSQVVIECDCCKAGWEGPRGQVRIYEWRCDVINPTVTGMEIDGEKVRYKFAGLYIGDAPVFATKEEADAERVKVLAAHVEEEAHRFAHVKDNAVRKKTWAFSVSYHRREAKEAKRRMGYHESKLAVAKAKVKSPEAIPSSGEAPERAQG